MQTTVNKIDLGTGSVTIEIALKNNLFYQILTEITGMEMKNEADLFTTIGSLSRVKKEYDKVSIALQEVRQKGYGIVTPTMEELILDEPEIVKQGSRFGVKLKARAPSIHMEQSKQINKFKRKTPILKMGGKKYEHCLEDVQYLVRVGIDEIIA